MILKFEDFIFELGDASLNPYNWKYQGLKKFPNGMAHLYTFKADEFNYEVTIEDIHGDCIVNFKVENEPSSFVTNRGHQYQVISTVLDIVRAYVDEYDPREISFVGANKDTEENGKVTSRTRLYREYVKKNIPDGYEMLTLSNTTVIVKK